MRALLAALAASLIIIPHADSVAGLGVATGSYVGNGTAGRSINGLGFRPDFIIIKGDNADPAVVRSSTMVGDAAKKLGTTQALTANLIVSLDSNGFTVGSDQGVNASGTTYYWTAFQAATARMAVGSYVGDDTDDRSITGIGFRPKYVIVMNEGDQQAMQRFATELSDASFEFQNSGEKSDRIQNLENSGFQVGTHPTVNEGGRVHYYVAWTTRIKEIEAGSYAGDGVDNRDISGLGFQPYIVIIKSETNQSPVIRTRSLVGDNTLKLDGGITFGDAIQALQSDGFQIGTLPAVNEAGKAFHWVAFCHSLSANMRVTKSADQITPSELDSVTFQIEATNLGPDQATAVTLVDNLPAGITYVSHTADQGSYAPATGMWDLGTLPKNGTALLAITATVDAGMAGSTIENLAAVAGLNEGDVNRTNDTGRVAITVLGHSPVLSPISPKTMSEDQTLVFDITATDGDGTIPVLIAEAVPANASFFNNGDGTGTFQFNPNFSQAGTYNVRFIASDGHLADTEYAAITVVDVNRAPVLSAIGSKTVDVGQHLEFTVTASDPDGTVPTLGAVPIPANATFVDNGNGTGRFEFNPSYSQSGLFTVLFNAFDEQLADTEIVVITVVNVNRPPAITPIGAKTVDEGQTLAFSVAAADPDGSTPTLNAVDLPADAAFADGGNGTGAFTFTPSFTQAGVYSPRFIASDGALADTETVTITVSDVNRPPVLNSIGYRVVAKDGNLNFNVSATDPDGTIPGLQVGNLPLHATFSDLGGGTGTFNFNPDNSQVGAYLVTFMASDGLLADSEVVSIAVADVDLPPIITPLPDTTITEGQLLALAVVARDPEGTSVELAAFNLPVNATFEILEDGSGNFTFSPSFTQAGSYSVWFIGNDGAGADTERVVITVLEAGNQPPILSITDPQTVQEGSTLVLQASATDPDGTIPALSAKNLPANAAFVDHKDGTGTFTFTPDLTQLGSYQVRFIAADQSLADTEIVSLTVFATQPTSLVISPDAAVVSADSTQQFVVTAYDGSGNRAEPGRISWSLTAPLGAIDTTGLFTAVFAGTGKVVARSSFGPVDTTSKLEVVPGRLASLTVSPDSLDVLIGDTARFNAEGFDHDSNERDAGNMQWGVVSGVGSIDAAGLFIATELGLGRISATNQAEGISDTNRIIHVFPNTLSRLVVQPDTASLKIDDSRSFSALGFNSRFEPATVGALTWQVIGRIGRIDSTGQFIATNSGIGYVVATSNIGGVSDTSDMIVVDVLTAEEIPLGNLYVSTGRTMSPVLAFEIDNRFDSPRSVSAVSVHNASRGKGLLEQVRASISSVSLFLDSDDNGILASNDALLAQTPLSLDSVAFAFSPVTAAPGSHITFFVSITVGSYPRDGDSLDMYLSPATDLRTTDGSTVGGPATINSLGFNIIDGLVARQIRLIPPVIDVVTMLSQNSHVLTIDLPRNGYSIDTLNVLTLTNTGTATNTDLDSLVLYVDDGDGVWDGPTSEQRIGPLKFTGGLWSISGLAVPLTGQVRHFQIGVRPSMFAANGVTVSLGVPLHGIEMASGNDGPIDAAVPPVGTVTITPLQAVTVASDPLPGRTLIPGTHSGPMTRITITNGTASALILDTVRIRLFATDLQGAPQGQLDSQIDSMRLWVDDDANPAILGTGDTLLATVAVHNGAAVFVGPTVLLPGGGVQRRLVISADLSLNNSKNGNRINSGLNSAADLHFNHSVPVDGAFPVRNTEDFIIDAFPAASVIVDTPSNTTLFEGQIDRLVFQFALPRNGYSPDVLQSIQLGSEGTISGLTAFSSVTLWQDSDENGFDAGDPNLGQFAYQNGVWTLSDLARPLASSTTRFLVTVNVSATVYEGGTLQMLIPVDGVHYASGMDGPDNAPVRNLVTHVLFPANRVTAISIPSPVAPILPGSEKNTIFSFALYNGYIGNPKTLQGISLTNTSRSRSTQAYADNELGQIFLYADDNGSRIFDGDSPIATGYFLDGRLRLSGLAQALPPESLSYFFVVSDVPREMIDSDSLAVVINSAADFEFSEAVNVNGDIPVGSGSYRIVDGSVAIQYDLIELAPTTIRPGDMAVPVFGFRPAGNGNRQDTLTALTIGNLGSAGEGDLTAVRLCLDRDGDTSYTAGDSILATFLPVGAEWEADSLRLIIGSSRPTLLILVDVSEAAVPGATLRLALPVNGCTYASANDGPSDRPIAAAGASTITGAPLRIAHLPLRKAYSVEQTIALTIQVRNTLATQLSSVAPSIVETVGSAIVSLDSSDAAPQNLAANETGAYRFFYTAMRPGMLSWRLKASASSPGDSSAIVETSPITIQSPPSWVRLELINSIPTSVIRGQRNVFPLSIAITHRDSVSAAPLRLDSIRVSADDGGGNPIPMCDIAGSLVLSAGYSDLAIVEQVPSQSAVLLAFDQPVIVPPGETRLLSLLVNIAESAQTRTFALGLTDGQSAIITDENTLIPVSLDPDIQFPLRTATCQLYEPAQHVAVSGNSLLGEFVDYGQINAPALRLTVRHPDAVGSSQIQLSRVACLLFDEAGQVIAPGEILDHVLLVEQHTVVGEVWDPPTTPVELQIKLNAPVTLSAGQSKSLNIMVSIKESPSRDAFEIAVMDSAAFTFRDLSSGSALTAVPDPLALPAGMVFPIRSGVTSLKQPADPPLLCLSSVLPPRIIGGADSVSLLQLKFSYPTGSDHAPILLRHVLVATLDTTGRMLDPYQIFDRVGYSLMGAPATYESFFRLAQGAIQFDLGENGLVLPPSDSIEVTLIADIEADVPYDHFMLAVMRDDALLVADAADSTRVLTVTVASGCSDGIPFTTSLTRIFYPAGPPRITIPQEAAQLAFPGQTGLSVFQVEMEYNPLQPQGDLIVRSFRTEFYRRAENNLVAVPPSELFDTLTLTVDGVVAATANSASNPIVFELQPTCVLSRGDSRSVRMVGDIKPTALPGNYVFELKDSSFLELVDEQLGTLIAPVLEGGQYPSLLSELAVSSVNLERSFTNFPNPFNPTLEEVTTIGFVLDDQADIDLSIFSITGEKIRDIVRRAPRATGPHQSDTWDGFNGAGEPVAPGTYYCRITARYASGRTEQFKRKVAVIR